MTLTGASAHPQEKLRPTVTVDLKLLGAAPDLFTDQSDSKYQQRGVIDLFWLGDKRLAVAFSTNRRWSSDQRPEPLTIRLIVFDVSGKQINDRAWNFGAEGPEGEMTLSLAAGPDNSILAIHESAGAGKIPEGNFIQVLNPDTSRRQDFYVPSTSKYFASVSPQPMLVLQTFYADKHSSLAWWSGHPLEAGVRLDLPRDNAAAVAGPKTAAVALCANPALCSGIQVLRIGAPTQIFTGPNYGDLVPAPLAFLSADELLANVAQSDQKSRELFVLRRDGSHTTLAALPKGLQVVTVTGVAADGRRFSLDAGGEAGICGGLDLWCKQRGLAMVFDVPSNRIVFQQEIAANGGVSSLSPDGMQFAIFDRDKLTIYKLQ